jgi:hypothetical protein
VRGVTPSARVASSGPTALPNHWAVAATPKCGRPMTRRVAASPSRFFVRVVCERSPTSVFGVKYRSFDVSAIFRVSCPYWTRTYPNGRARRSVRGIAHRDIKPENLYRSESSWVIGDFGLIDAPNVDPLTVGAHELGPRNYLAPEMVLDAANADGAAADVYSLGKTLWVLLTSLPMPPPGELSRVVDGKRLADRGVQHPRAFRLERLLEQMTKESPKSRPPMAEVAKTLRNWVASSGGSTDDPESKEMNLEDVVEAVAEVFTGTPLSTNRNRIEDKR